MSPSGTVAAHHLWKRFRPDRSRSLIRDHIERLRTHGPRKSWTWALRDVNFEIEPGGSFAFIGSNGSGKSTLLKILSEVMYPYAGTIEAVGRVGALIEVASGIHPDLTGRENCYLYGSLLGLHRTRVAARFDDIVAFAELEDAIDRQVKFYSSGMKMRLGFAVAAFLEPDVLLVDEVLAVGDASFQQRCLDRMREVLAQGTTLVYVSHDLATVEAMCSSALWLKKGVVEEIGATADVLAGYRRWIEEGAEEDSAVEGDVRVLKAAVMGVERGAVTTGEPFRIEIRLQAPEPRSGTLQVGISQGPASPLVLFRNDVEIDGAELDVRCTVPSLPFAAGRYYLWLGIYGDRGRAITRWHPTGHFDVVGPPLDHVPVGIVRLAPIHLHADWTVTEV
ncbi:MAG TPA: ABC transporter ATP-binding protein [Acidimicrobiales bacterium]|nr:ABC transporter ATP-binding protein [Acidimicrobiales bacterium]